MADLEDKLNAILGNPEAMGQIMSIARSLSDSGSEKQAAPPPSDGTDPPEAPEAEPSDARTPDPDAVSALLSGLTDRTSDGGGSPLSALSGLDPALVQIALRLFAAYSAEDDRRTALLNALKPFLKEERQAKMEKAIQIAKFSRVIRVAFQLFKKEGGGADV